MSYDVQNSGTKAVQHRSVGRECGQCGTRFFGIVVDTRGIARTDVCGCEVEIVDPDQELDDEIDRGDGPITDGGRDRWEYGHAAARRADQSDRELRADGGDDLLDQIADDFRERLGHDRDPDAMITALANKHDVDEETVREAVPDAEEQLREIQTTPLYDLDPDIRARFRKRLIPTIDNGPDPVNNPEDRRLRSVRTPESSTDLLDVVADLCHDSIDAGVDPEQIERVLGDVIDEVQEVDR